MKKVTTNLTSGQILFILFILIVSSLMFFYLGAKFGGDTLSFAQQQTEERLEPFLPDSRLSAEIEELLVQHKGGGDFYASLEDKGRAHVPPVAATKTDGMKPVGRERETTIVARAPETKTPALEGKNAAGKVFMPGDKVSPLPETAKSTVAVKTPAPLKKEEERVKVLMPGITPPQRTALSSQTAEKNDGTVSAPKAGGLKTYRLQVGSYSQRERAIEAKSEWEARGFSVSLVESKIPGKGSWYRLHVGRYGSLDEVQLAQRRIMQSYRQTAMILPE